MKTGKSMISGELLSELQLIMQEEYGIALENDETVNFGEDLVGMFDALIELDNANDAATSQ